MATLGKNMPFPNMDDYLAGNYQAAHEKEQVALADIEARLPVLRFPRGDGFALYAVASTQPLVLRWIPYGDAWEIAAHEIRGLRLADVREMLESRKALTRALGKRATPPERRA